MGRVVEGRDAPLVASWARWAALTAAAGTVLAVIAAQFASFPSFPFGRVGLVGSGTAVVSALVLAHLRAEESRLTRELRTARTGSATLRQMVLARRQRLPAYFRWISTTLGMAAVLLADGDAAAATDALSADSRLFGFGRIRVLRAWVEADLARADGGAGARAGVIEQLGAARPMGHREADRYRLHVLVRALLEEGDAERAERFFPELEASKDEEVRVYVTWLRTWFDLDEGAPCSEGDLRLAALLARTHGAAELVAKIDGRIAAVISGG